MTRYVALLRGINVGGHGKVPMKELRVLCEGLGWENPRTLLASGNLVFDCHQECQESLSSQLREAVKEQFEVDTPIVLLEEQEFLKILDDDPIEAEGKRSDWLTVMFFTQMPSAATIAQALERHQGPEIVKFGSRAAYIYFSEGLGRSKLNLGKAVHEAATVRNRNTLKKVAELLTDSA